MGFRFQRRVGLPGKLARLNISKSGLSVSVGPRGLSYNVGLFGPRAKEDNRLTIGLPGSGLSYRMPMNFRQTSSTAQGQTSGTGQGQASNAAQGQASNAALTVWLVVCGLAFLVVLAIAFAS
jgi:hypothetical protein